MSAPQLIRPKPKDSPEVIDTLIAVRSEDVPRVWPKIEHYLHEANEYGGGKLTMHDWLVKTLCGYSELLVSPDHRSAVIGEPQQYPRKRVYGVILMGGEGDHPWESYQQVFEDRAKLSNCTSVEIFGRPGWKNILEQRLGYSRAHWVWRKEV